MSNLDIPPRVLLFLLLWGILFIFFYTIPIRLWVAAKTAGAGDAVTFWLLISLRFRRVPPEVIVNPLIVASVAGLRVDPKRLEDLWRKRGDLEQVVAALIASHHYGMNHAFDELATINLAGHDAIKHIQSEAEKRGLRSPQQERPDGMSQPENMK